MSLCVNYLGAPSAEIINRHTNPSEFVFFPLRVALIESGAQVQCVESKRYTIKVVSRILLLKITR
jgi:hypothetical protein